MTDIEEQKSLILGILADFLEEIDDLEGYAKHVGFDFAVLRRPEDLIDAWLAHYRVRRGEYDVDRALEDLTTWPPIARRIEFLRQEQCQSVSR